MNNDNVTSENSTTPDPKVLLLLSGTNPNFETEPEHYWDAITTHGKSCKIDRDLIPDPPRNSLRPGLAYGRGKLFLCMGAIYNETFDPLEYSHNKLVNTYNDCLYFDLENKTDKEWKNLPNSEIDTFGSQPQLTVDGNYLYCLTWNMTLETTKRGKIKIKKNKNHVFRYNIVEETEGWEEIQIPNSNMWKPTEK